MEITCDWEHAYVGCSAKENSNIGTVWRELLLVTRNTGLVIIFIIVLTFFLYSPTGVISPS